MALSEVGRVERLYAVDETYVVRKEMECNDVGMEGVPAEPFEPKGAGYLFDVCIAAFAGQREGDDGEVCNRALPYGGAGDRECTVLEIAVVKVVE